MYIQIGFFSMETSCYNFAELNNEYNAKGNNNYSRTSRKNLKGQGFNPGTAYNVGKRTRIPGHASSGDFL